VVGVGVLVLGRRTDAKITPMADPELADTTIG
jgi:hypothetical protein